MHAQVEQFLDHMAYERGLAENTRAAYASDLAAFVGFLQRSGSVRSFAAVTRMQVAAFLEEQRRLGRGV